MRENRAARNVPKVLDVEGCVTSVLQLATGIFDRNLARAANMFILILFIWPSLVSGVPFPE